MQPKELLLIPGPTPVPDSVLRVTSSQPIGHRSQELSKSLRVAIDEMKWLGETKNDLFVFTASGTGAMEAAIANTINPGDVVLSLVCGVFGERWTKIAAAYGAQVEKLSVTPGSAISVAAVKERLAKDTSKTIKAVTITHNETSTGVINDLEQIVKLVSDHGALSIVDAVTSFGAAHLPIDKWGVDILVTGSQKALMLPPGLSFIFISEKAFAASAKCKTPRFYFDFERNRKSFNADTTPFTPNVSLILGLKESLGLLKEEGREKVFARHLHLKQVLRGGLSEMGVKLLADESCASPTVTSALPPEGLTVDAIRKELKEKFRITIADGQEDLKGKIFRISHMGNVFERDMICVLSALKNVFATLGYKG
jgi:aspartate aminotransferase-like enzyme